MSQVFFFDIEGDDKYITGGKKLNYGWNNFDKENPPEVGLRYHLYSDQICLFADINETDTYQVMDYENGKVTADSLMREGAEIYYPTKEEKEKLDSKRYYGLGKDFINWEGKEIEYFKDKMNRKFEEFK